MIREFAVCEGFYILGIKMANGKDPAFLFYPGDYLRDTQCLSEKTQVAYDRIMCEHMRNICITKQQLKFFTKRLNDDEISELKMLLREVNGGYQIEWVALSIDKRREYSKSRRENRIKKNKNISKSYDRHMENEIENVNEIKDRGNGKGDPFIVSYGQFFPSKLIDIGFEEHWMKWIDFNEERGTPITPIQAKEQLKYLAGIEKPIEQIELCIKNNWKGLEYAVTKRNNGRSKNYVDPNEVRDDLEKAFSKSRTSS